MIKRIHISNDPNLTFENKSQIFSYSILPVGLWYKITGKWADWLKKMKSNKEKTYHYEIQIKEEEIIRLDNSYDLLLFQRKYVLTANSDYLNKEQQILETKFSTHISGVDWQKVAKDYAGIEIYPHTPRFIVPLGSWYKKWYSSGGCIWDERAIEKIEKL